MKEKKDILDENFTYLDKDNLIEDLEKVSYHTEEALTLGEVYSHAIFNDFKKIELLKKIKNIVFLGMGGSAIGGNLISGYLADEISVPIELIRGYDLPGYVDENSLVFAVS